MWVVVVGNESSGTGVQEAREDMDLAATRWSASRRRGSSPRIASKSGFLQKPIVQDG